MKKDTLSAYAVAAIFIGFALHFSSLAMLIAFAGGWAGGALARAV